MCRPYPDNFTFAHELALIIVVIIVSDMHNNDFVKHKSKKR